MYNSKIRYQPKQNLVVKKSYKGLDMRLASSTFQEPSQEFPAGLILTGWEDGRILVFQPNVPDPLYELEGHIGAVKSLFVGR